MNFFPFQITSNKLVCQRPLPSQTNCQLTKENILYFPTKTITIKELQGAKVVRQQRGDYHSQLQQIILLTEQGEIELSSVTTFHPDVTITELNGITSNINDFVKNSQTASLKVDRDNIGVFRVFLLVISINIVWLGFCSEVVTCIFDKTSGLLIKKRQWFLIKRTVKYPLQDIIDVQVQERWNRSVKCYRISLLRASGKDIHLTGYYTNYLKKRKQIDATADAIISFLNRRKV
ncbi:hypothetical protein [Nostoc sp. FACHB-110]|uniref:hypothetical protein n=1 Tax=Nostoc sp. FACHB-110 TaxID=2692834 RepID=UPI001683E244|nr:hypothetical protein [Nostoc sp. FACHB-110]MBD2441544.1 hypothetical protein [Nostoc sp. FACHB-110]